MGFGLMSTANNHMLDYSYGGMFATHAALDAAGIAHAGSGRDLGAARSAAFADMSGLRVALVSMVTSCTAWSRAGEPREGVPGRPGVNPLRVHYAVSRERMEAIREIFSGLGWWIARVSDSEWEINPAGLHHSIIRFHVSDDPAGGAVIDARDASDNLRAIRNVRGQADIVITHIHNHEWDTAKGTAYPPAFLPPFARAAIEAGSDIVFAQGSHAPLRGIEIHDGKPIFYDTGDLFAMSNSVTRVPQDFIDRHLGLIGVPRHEAVGADAIAARFRYHIPGAVYPPGGYRNGRLRAGIIPVLEYDGEARLLSCRLHPFLHHEHPVGLQGVPFKADGESARAVIATVEELSAVFGTRIGFDGGCGTLPV
jgi:poly-gamma-glutamate synthesis protein (capsule biosynthesis protein)